MKTGNQEKTVEKAAIGIIGLAVMGANLARNFERNGFKTAVYNRTQTVTEGFIANFSGNFLPAYTLEDFVASLERPRKLLVMVQAGEAVDKVIETLVPLLEQGDVILDGGNSHFDDTARRVTRCQKSGIDFLGVGVSGGEEGALWGPSIMPGGSKTTWSAVAPLLEAIAAKADGPCVTYIGPEGSGHFVKMVHNGIEYADMQLIAESYDVLRRVGGYQPAELAQLYQKWNEGPLQSFLIEITSDIFKKKDDNGSGYLIDKILDKAGQKGTGKWTVQCALDFGAVISVIDAAVIARTLSSQKDQRVAFAPLLGTTTVSATRKQLDKKTLEQCVHDALLVAKIISYAQGMNLIAKASVERIWDLNLSEIARIWKGGCIIRAKMLDDIQIAYQKPNPALGLLGTPLGRVVVEKIESLRTTVTEAIGNGVPVPALSAALAYFESVRTVSLPQNLTQAQRDYFGAHTYERTDRPGSFHSEWAPEQK
jgi:6-phosphogluconate dehydrogenase